MPEASLHPAALLKRVLREYLSTFIAPGSDAVYPAFGDSVGIPVIGDEDQDHDLLPPAGPDILIFENAPSEELHEGMEVWKLSLTVTLTLPGDTPPEKFAELEQTLWRQLAGKFEGDVAGGGDAPGPLAGRLNAAALLTHQEHPDEFPRVLCVGDVWQVRREPPTLDSPAARVMQFNLLAIAEVMPPDFAPAS